MKSHSLLLLLACAAVNPAWAGSDDDFGVWAEATVQKDLPKNFSINGGFEFRADDNVSQPSRWAFTLGAGYKPTKFLSLGAGYVFIHDYKAQSDKVKYKTDDITGELELDDFGNPIPNGYNVDHGHWRNRHRAYFDVTGKVEFGRFTLSLRERYQYTNYVGMTINQTEYRGLIDADELNGYNGPMYEYNGQYFERTHVEPDVKKTKNKHYLRSRLQLEYNINNCHWTPYVSYEFSNDLQDKLDLEKTRLKAGAEWKITKQHRLDVAYLWEHATDPGNHGNHHVISLGYKFKF